MNKLFIYVEFFLALTVFGFSQEKVDIQSVVLSKGSFEIRLGMPSEDFDGELYSVELTSENTRKIKSNNKYVSSSVGKFGNFSYIFVGQATDAGEPVKNSSLFLVVVANGAEKSLASIIARDSPPSSKDSLSDFLSEEGIDFVRIYSISNIHLQS